jgi:DNA-binding beta-propeller fold protein YncE
VKIGDKYSAPSVNLLSSPRFAIDSNWLKYRKGKNQFLLTSKVSCPSMNNRQNNYNSFFSARYKILIIIWVVCMASLVPAPNKAMAEIETSFLYQLSSFGGPIPFNWASISVDAERNEIYVVDKKEANITVFNDQGMEVYHFGDDRSLGAAVDAALDKDGNILVLSRNRSNASIIKCNFRGEPIEQFALKDFPPDFSPFSPDRIIYRQELLYLLDSSGLRVAVTDAKGLFQNGYDLGTLVGIEENKRDGTDIDGFSVDSEGNMLFTIPVKFAAFVLSPDGQYIKFGRPGGAPGKFNNVGGIVADDQGYYYVADKLKSAILIFDKDFRFQLEFGYRGSRPENLNAPRNLALDSHGRLYVSQLGKGISVFQITYK